MTSAFVHPSFGEFELFSAFAIFKVCVFCGNVVRLTEQFFLKQKVCILYTLLSSHSWNFPMDNSDQIPKAA